jgi:ribonuclease HII
MIKVKLSPIKYLIGIDEVGRGPIAGPVAVGAFCISIKNISKVRRIFRGVKESKQLSEPQREGWFGMIEQAQENSLIDFAVSFQSEKVIDAKGLSYAIKKALTISLYAVVKDSVSKRVVSPTRALYFDQMKVLLDGGLKAPSEFVYQKTIIKGDEKELVIALASICAKVLRDRKMNTLAKKHPEYGFERHKGYGTRGHYDAIKKSGLLAVHRRSFLGFVCYP